MASAGALNPAFAHHISRSLPQARAQALRLYRRSLKSCDEVKKIFQVPVSVADMKKKLRVEFLRHSHINDPVVIDMLVLKGFNNLEEATGNFTFRAHVWNFFEHISLDAAPTTSLEERLEQEAMDSFTNPDPRRSLPRRETYE